MFCIQFKYQTEIRKMLTKMKVNRFNHGILRLSKKISWKNRPSDFAAFRCIIIICHDCGATLPMTTKANSEYSNVYLMVIEIQSTIHGMSASRMVVSQQQLLHSQIFRPSPLQKYGFMVESKSTILFMPLPSIHLPTMPAEFYALCRCIQRSFPLEIRFCWCDRCRPPPLQLSLFYICFLLCTRTGR